MTLELPERIRGCLLGGAVGDALGAPYEFATWDQIQEALGPAGVTDVFPPGRFTDDTQMTLFTCEGLIHAQFRYLSRGIIHPPSILHLSYLHWLVTQGYEWLTIGRGEERPGGWLVQEPKLHRQEAPGATCLSALQSGDLSPTGRAPNHSKGCGGVMRAAPAGFVGPMATDQEMAYRSGCDAAAVTHGHPDGIHSAGLFAALISGVMQGYSLRESYKKAAPLTTDRMREVVGRALSLGEAGVPEPEVIENHLGGGWVGDEALAIAVACAVGAPDYTTGVLAAVNHSGDTDSTGSICGNLLGALYGEERIPTRWLEKLDGREIVASVADDCVTWTLKYPIVNGGDRETEQYFFDRYVLPV